MNSEAQVFLRELFDSFIDETLQELSVYKVNEPIPTVEIQAVTCLCNILEYFITPQVGNFSHDDSADSFRQKLTKFFAYAFIWGLGGAFSTEALGRIDNIFKKSFSKLIPPQETVFDYYLDPDTLRFTLWNNKVPEFEYDSEIPFFSILVPTMDT